MTDPEALPDEKKQRSEKLQSFTALLRIVLNILKTDQSRKGRLPFKRREAALDPTYRETLLLSRA